MTAVHEAGHIRLNLVPEWHAMLKKHRALDKQLWMQVSSYSANGESELFAEVTSMYYNGFKHKIPKEILSAFEDALELSRKAFPVRE